jgi:hypothetical protein
MKPRRRIRELVQAPPGARVLQHDYARFEAFPGFGRDEPDDTFALDSFRGASGVQGLAARIIRCVCTIQAFASCSLANPSMTFRVPFDFAISTSKRWFARGITR